MTKILIEHNFHHPFNPNKITGGCERFCHQIFLLLKEKGYDITLAVPNDTDNAFICEGIEKLPLVSKQYRVEKGKKLNHVAWWRTLNDYAKQFDIVVINSEMTSPGMFKCEELAKKAILINHYKFVTAPSMMAFRYMMCSLFIRKHGGVVLACSEELKRKSEYLWSWKGNKAKEIYSHYVHHFDGIDQLYDGTIDINILANDLAPLASTNGKSVIAVGRPERGKRMLLATKTLVSLGDKGYDCEIFITPYGKDLQEILDTVRGTNVKLHLGADHSEIMKGFARSDLHLFPSKDEASGGVTAFEAASSGCKVLFSIPEPKYFLDKSGGVFTESNSVKKLEAEIISILSEPSFREAQRDWYRDQYSNDKVADRLLEWIV